jgi:serine protease AprX
MGTADTKDDTIGSYSAAANGCGNCRNPDVVAVGSHVQGLRVEGSYIDVNHPEGRLDDRGFRGSGTSQAAAIASGSIALVLQKYPGLTPDQVKQFITANAMILPATGMFRQGGGELDLAGLLTANPGVRTIPRPIPLPGTGIGSLDRSRGSDRLTLDGVTLVGEQDIFGQPFKALPMAIAEALGRSWSGGTWNGRSWSGSDWAGRSWSSTCWTGRSWSGSDWLGRSWSGRSWSGRSWSGGDWSGRSWSGRSWSGGVWAGGSWN